MKKALFYVLSALTLMFTGLKLADKIDWSWWWVFSPVWIPALACVAVTVASQCYLIYQYRHDEQFRKTMDDYREVRRRSEMTLADRLEEMRRQAEDLRKRRDLDKNGL